MAETPKAPPSGFRQDLLRGMRWGTILILAMLLGLTAYRVLSSSEATASQPKVVEELTPAPVGAPAGPIQIGDAVLIGPDAPAVPEAPKVRKAPAKAAPAAVEAPQRWQAPTFAPLPVVAAPAPTVNTLVAEPVLEATPAPPTEVVVPTAVLVPGPPPATAPADDSKSGNRATRAVRSVGRLFGLGRKDPGPKDQPTK